MEEDDSKQNLEHLNCLIIEIYMNTKYTYITHSEEISISVPMIYTKACKFASDFDIENFNTSNGIIIDRFYV